jgi:hypothetical protein
MLRIRQLALAARHLAPTLDPLLDVLDLRVAYEDPGVATFGLENAVMAAGDDFLEIVAPVRDGTTAGRWLDRQGGDAGYMVILQTDDLDAARARVDAEGVRVVWDLDHDGARAIHLHPRDVGGAILSFDVMPARDDWAWAGPDWRGTVSTSRVAGIAAARMGSPDPLALAERWARLCDRPVTRIDGDPAIALDGNTLRFVAAEREALVGIDLKATDARAFTAAAGTAGVAEDGGARIGGVLFRAV